MAEVKRKRKKLKLNEGEQRISAQLTTLGVDFTFEPHSFKYNVPATYTPDFVVSNPSTGAPIYVEIKGMYPGIGLWCSKIKHFKAAHPDIDYRIVFLDASKKMNKNYKSNLGDWATRQQIPWADGGVIPDEWFK